MIDYDTGLAHAAANDMMYFGVSAKTGSNVEDAFQWILGHVLNRQLDQIS